MAAFFVYSLKTSLCLAAFYLFYKLLLSRDTFHHFNRMALLGMMVLSAAIPVIALIFTPGDRTLELMTDLLPVQMEVLDSSSSATLESPNRLLSLVLLFYLTGCVLYVMQTLWTLSRILRLIRQGERIRIDRHIRLTIHSDCRIAPFSWMNNIVVSRTDLNEAGETILLHEQAHIRQLHSVDLLLAELCLLFQWYNPAAWLFYRELQHIHEFEADRFVLSQGVDAKQYQLLIIKKAVGTRLYSMANSFNHSNLKKRITMMLQKKSNAWARLKYAYVLPLAAISLIAFARPEITKSFEGISNAKVSNLILKVDPPEVEKIFSDTPPPIDMADPLPNAPVTTQVSDTTVFEIVEEMPEFPGGLQACINYLNDNIQYPAAAIENGIQGRVTTNFIVEKDGSISNVQVLRNVHPALDAEAVRVTAAMPKWKPGKQRGQVVRVYFNLPVVFKLKP